jgi:hypothetical protein
MTRKIFERSKILQCHKSTWTFPDCCMALSIVTRAPTTPTPNQNSPINSGFRIGDPINDRPALASFPLPSPDQRFLTVLLTR